MKKLLRDYPMNEWMEAADGCQFCRSKYQVRITYVDETGSFGDITYKIQHKEDCPDRFDEELGIPLTGNVVHDIAGWEYHDYPFTFRGVQYYPLKSRVNVGPCHICTKLVIGVPLILFIDEGRGGELNFCFPCAEEKGMLEKMIKR